MTAHRHPLIAGWLPALSLALLLGTAASVGMAQDEPVVPAAEPQTAEGDAESFDAEGFTGTETGTAETEGDTEGGGDAAGTADDAANIDDILAQDEDVLYGNQATYDPGARRDPFRSLLQREQAAEVTTARPEGIPGLLIDEIELEGVFMTADGPVAQIRAASDETSYLLRPGDQLWDGDVVSVSLTDITFKQSINDPTALKPFREVVKKLNP